MIYRKTKFIIWVGILIPLVVIYLYWYFTPCHLCSSPNYISEFFDLPNNSIGIFVVEDVMYNQGKTTFSFGESYYCLKFKNSEMIIDAIRGAGGIYKDSKWELVKKRGNYIGTISVSSKNGIVYLHYLETCENLDSKNE